MQSLTITSCGNFGLVGYSSGEIDVYNLQSGLYRGSYGKETGEIRLPPSTTLFDSDGSKY